MSILGYSEPSVNEYLISMAKKARGPDEIVALLEDVSIPISDATRAFAAQLYSRIPRDNASRLTDMRKQEMEAIARRKRNEAYKLLLDDEESKPPAAAASAATSTSTSTTAASDDPKKKRSIRKTTTSTKEDLQEEGTHACLLACLID